MVDSQVFDIRDYVPSEGDQFFVDTNVLVWSNYTRASHNARDYQTSIYPKFLMNMFNKSRSSLYLCEVVFSELAHVITRSEVDVAMVTHKLIEKPSIKTFREKFTQDWQNCVSEIEDSYNFAKTITNKVSVTIDENLNEFTMKQIKNFAVDSYDCYQVATMKKKNILNILTDDADFCQFSGINIFTANKRIIQRASKSGTLNK